MKFKTIANLSQDIQVLIPKLPTDLDLVVGIPRSGLIVANLLSVYLNLPLTDVAGLCEKRIFKTGLRFKKEISFKEIRKVLVVDDTINSGASMEKVRSLIESTKPGYKIYYAAIYATPEVRKRVDFYTELLDYPRCFEWNIMHHELLERSCMDLDGILCRDPTDDENDDGERYRHFLINVEPLIKPTVEIGWIVTCRLEKYRSLTEEWLKKQGIRYKQLVMMNLPDKATRIALGNYAQFKAQAYKSTNATLFIESSIEQASEIARISEKDVICTNPSQLIEGRTTQVLPSIETPPKEYVAPQVKLEDENKFANISSTKRRSSLSVCFFSHAALLEGAERSLLELVTELSQDYGVFCSVILPSDGPLKKRLEDVAAATLVMDYSWWSEPSFNEKDKEDRDNRLTSSLEKVLVNLRQSISKLNPDVIFTNTLSIPWGAITAAFLGKPHVWFVREFGTLDRGLKYFYPSDIMLDFVKSSSNIILTNSNAVKEKHFGDTSNKNIQTVYSFINIPSSSLSRDKEKYFTRTRATKLLISGSLYEAKGQKDAVLAVKELVKRQKNVELIIMGGISTEYANNLVSFVEREKLGAYVKFIGYKENPYPVMNQADIVLTCSRIEAFGRVTLEAMLLKKPVIATKVGGIPELITDGFNGFLYKPGNHLQLADKIEYLISNPKKIREMGKNGYNYAKKKFTRKEYGGKIYDLLNSLKKQANPLSSQYSDLLSGLISNALYKLATNLQAKESQIVELNTNIQAENQKITELSTTLQAKDAEIAELNTNIQAENQKITELNTNLETEDQKMTELSYTLLVKNSEIAGLNADLQTKNQKIAELSTTLQAEDAEIAELNADLQTEKQKIAELSTTLQAGDAEIAELNADLQTEKQKIAELSTTLQAGDAEIAELNADLQAENQKIAELNNTLQVKDTEIAELKTTLQNKEYQISSIDLQIQQIQGGVGMRLLKKYRQLIDKLLPVGKRRRYYYGLLMKGARIILDEGWRSFFKKTRNWFRRRRSLVKKPTLVLPRLRALKWEKVVQKIVFPKPSRKPELSIVIPVHNKLRYTLNCLQSIYLNTKADYEVIVVDDASTDKTAEALSKIKNLSLIRNIRNVGFIDSVSRGADECRGNYIIFLNNDTMVTKDWLPPLLTLIKRDDVGAVGAKLVYPDGKLQEAGGIIWSDGLGWNFGRGDDPEKPEYNYVREVDYCSGACLCVKRKLFKRIGGFDKRFRPAYFDDSDLCFSIRNLGYKVLYQPMTVIAHHEGVSSGTDTSSGVKKFQEINRPKFIEKWHDVLGKKHYLHDDANDFVARERVSGKRILIIDHYVPTYDKDAGSLTIYQYTKLFNDMGFKVIFIPDNMYRSEPYTSELQQMGIEVIYGQANFQFNFDSWIKENGHYIDIVFLSRPHISLKYIDAIKRYTKAKILYYMHDLHYLRELRRYEIKKDPRILKESQRWKNIEFRLFNGADVVLTPSSAEADIISSELPKKQKNIKVIPPYLYDEFPKKNALASFRAKKDIVFLGGFQHTPNIDAVQWFVEKCFPRIVKAIPDVKFFIVGSSPVPEIEKLASANVKVTGYVKDLAPIFGKARVFVAPLRYGAGLKGKIVTSMYYGVPVVTTTIGAEGMDLTDGVDALIADDAAEFAKKVVTLYKDKSLWHKLSENSIKKVKADYSLEAARKTLKSILGQDLIKEEKLAIKKQNKKSPSNLIKKPLLLDNKPITTCPKVLDNYSRKIVKEIDTYKDKLCVRDLPDIHHYWSNKYIKPKMQALGISDEPSLFADPIEKLVGQTNQTVRIASLGSGNCVEEITIVKRLLERGRTSFEMKCFDINQDMLERGKGSAEREKISQYFKFIRCDVNKLKLDQKYDVIMANQSLHHFVNLEHIFETIRFHLKPNGYFIVSDMIGRNGHMRWPEAYEVVCQLWHLLPPKYKWNHQLKRQEEEYDNWDCSKEGFEGIRSQDILPLLIKYFKFELFFAYGNIIDVFVDRNFGPNFNPNEAFDREFIDYVAQLDEKMLKEGTIKPTHLVARMKLKNPTKVYMVEGVTPQTCVRVDTNGI